MSASLENRDLTSYANNAWSIFRLALPLILTAASTSLMLVLDRLVLSNYSFHAMNAVTNAGASIGVFQYGFLSLTTIATVFAGKHNGAKNYHLVSQPIWQMIWFSIMSSIFFIALGLFAGEHFVNPAYYDEGLPYYKLIMCFGFMISLIGAISSFYISIGKIKIITFTVIGANIINIGLDILLIFGVDNLISPMGTLGAAIATVIGQLFQFFVLFLVFLSSSNRKSYNTTNYRINFKALKQCLRVGAPMSLSHVIEFSAWAFIIYSIGHMGDEYMLVFSIGHTLFFLYMFALDGLQKITASVASNLLGSQKKDKLSTLVLSSGKVHLIFCMLFAIPAFLYPEILIKAFTIVSNEEIYPSINQSIRYTLIFVWFYFVIDGFTWIFASVLQAFEDTVVPMFINGFATWTMAVMPIMIFVINMRGDPELLWALPCLYTSSLAIVYGIRMHKKIQNYTQD